MIAAEVTGSREVGRAGLMAEPGAETRVGGLHPIGGHDEPPAPFPSPGPARAGAPAPRRASARHAAIGRGAGT